MRSHRPAQARAVGGLFQPAPGKLQTAQQERSQPGVQAEQRLGDLGAIRDHALGRLAGSQRPLVGDHVGDGQIVFVADAGNDGNARVVDRLGDDFLVERPEVLQTAAAPTDDQDVDGGQRPARRSG